MSLIPLLKWYQTKSNIFITIDMIIDSDPKFIIESNKIKINFNYLNNFYETELLLFDTIDCNNILIIKSRYQTIKLNKINNFLWDSLVTNKNDFKNKLTYNWDFDSNDSESENDKEDTDKDFLNQGDFMKQFYNNNSDFNNQNQEENDDIDDDDENEQEEELEDNKYLTDKDINNICEVD